MSLLVITLPLYFSFKSCAGKFLTRAISSVSLLTVVWSVKYYRHLKVSFPLRKWIMHFFWNDLYGECHLPWVNVIKSMWLSHSIASWTQSGLKTSSFCENVQSSKTWNPSARVSIAVLTTLITWHSFFWFWFSSFIWLSE